MKLYFDCGMGASGNMIMAALYELLPDKELFKIKMDSLNLPGVEIIYAQSVKCGISGTHISVKVAGVEEISDDEHDHEHEHRHHHHDLHKHDHNHDNRHEHNHNHNHNRDHNHPHISHSHHHHDKRYSYKDILELIQSLDLPCEVKENASNVYKIIGQAEAKVHGTPLDEIHFHEVGSIDAIVDVVGCSLLIDMLGISEVTTSPVHVGFGKVRCEHGILPVPAPATAEILQGIPMYGGRIEGELCTPTGAALLKCFTATFGPMPIISAEKIGYGMGTKDFPAANCIRAFIYDDATQRDDSPPCLTDTVTEISCNLDDMTPEAIGAAFEILLENGALDVYTAPIMMKKNRPATMLSCLCRNDQTEFFSKLILKHTTTLGVRIKKYDRIIMDRTIETVKTVYGDIKVKKSEAFGITKTKPEYNDIISASKKHDIPFQTIREEITGKI